MRLAVLLLPALIAACGTPSDAVLVKSVECDADTTGTLGEVRHMRLAVHHLDDGTTLSLCEVNTGSSTTSSTRWVAGEPSCELTWDIDDPTGGTWLFALSGMMATATYADAWSPLTGRVVSLTCRQIEVHTPPT